MEMNFIFKFLELMKKLRLNKETIARLNNPEQIYGGLPPTYDLPRRTESAVCVSLLSCTVCDISGSDEFTCISANDPTCLGATCTCI